MTGFCAVVVSYHTGPSLKLCLQALVDAPLCAQIIVVNNGNPPETVQDLHTLAGAHPNLTLCDGHGNIGFGAGCNLGAHLATRPFLVFVNPDCVIDPQTLPAFQAAFDLTPDALLGGALRNRDGSEQRGSRRGEMTLWSACISFLGLGKPGLEAGVWRDFNRSDEPAPTAPVDMPTVSGALMALSKTSFEALYGFDPAYFLHVEDVDLCRRARAAGLPVLYVPSASALHIGGTSDVSSWTVERAKVRSFFYYFWTYSKWPFGKLIVMLTMPLLAAAILGRLLVKNRH